MAPIFDFARARKLELSMARILARNSGEPTSIQDPYAETMEMMAHQMEMQAIMQGQYMQQMSLLQEEQLRMQEEAARAALIEHEKSPSDFSQANADDTARKKLLRRGLMSTFTRYGNAGGGAKATKMGG